MTAGFLSQFCALAFAAVVVLPAAAAERPAAAPAGAAQQMPVVMAMRLQETAGKSRLVLELSDPFDFRIFLLAAPERVVIDMPPVLWRASELPPAGRAIGEGYRFGRFRA